MWSKRFTLELRNEACDFVHAQAKERNVSKSEVVRKALNVLATVDDDNIEIILHDKRTGEHSRLLIAQQ